MLGGSFTLSIYLPGRVEKPQPGGMGADYALKLPVVKRCVPKCTG